MAAINNGAIFVLLLPNVIFLALTMYTTEHVISNYKQMRNQMSIVDVFYLLYTGHIGLGTDCISYRLHGMLTVLAVHLLPLCNNDDRAHCIPGRYCIWCKLVWLSTHVEKTFDSYHSTFTRGDEVQWIWFHLLHIGSSSKVDESIMFLLSNISDIIWESVRLSERVNQTIR